MTESSRLFFALWPDEATRSHLNRIKQSVIMKKYRWTPKNNLHVTLVFLGQVDKKTEAKLITLASAITADAFELTFDGLSYWKKPGILCVTSSQTIPEDLIKLVSSLSVAAESCGIDLDPRPYKPHITLARHAREMPAVTVESLTWRARSFHLVKSCSVPNGVYYQPLHEWPLNIPNANSDPHP